MSPELQKAYSQTVGLTGIMGSGKSTAALMFAELTACVIDADQLAREVVSQNYPNYEVIRALIESTFQPLAQTAGWGELYSKAGELDRKTLGKIAFSHGSHVKALNKILHIPIQELFMQKVEKCPPQSVIIYDVPLLFETDMHKYLKKTIVVYVPEAIAIERAVRRTGLSKEIIQDRLSNQISIEKKRSLADYVLKNTGTVQELREQVLALWVTLKALH